MNNKFLVIILIFFALIMGYMLDRIQILSLLQASKPAPSATPTIIPTPIPSAVPSVDNGKAIKNQQLQQLDVQIQAKQTLIQITEQIALKNCNVGSLNDNTASSQTIIATNNCLTLMNQQINKLKNELNELQEQRATIVSGL